MYPQTKYNIISETTWFISLVLVPLGYYSTKQTAASMWPTTLIDFSAFYNWCRGAEGSFKVCVCRHLFCWVLNGPWEQIGPWATLLLTILNPERTPEQSTVSTDMPQTPFWGGGGLSKATDSPWKDPKSWVNMVCSCGVPVPVDVLFLWSRPWTSITWPCLSIISLPSAGLSEKWTRLGCQAWCSRASSL